MTRAIITKSIHRTALAAAAMLLVASVAVPPSAAGVSKKGAGAVAADSTPFARVYLALRGCTACSHCRTTIRQMVRSTTDGGETKVANDRVEVRYTTPRQLPLRQVIRSLADNRLHDLSVVDVLFEARGTLATAKNGGATFTLDETGQTFPLSIGASLARPADGSPVHLVALVSGWRENAALSLVAREMKPGA
ncbi:MAG TPA: hypothetical protein VJW75_01300 [Candidatus Eisenbacteria bacterium]|nr:hypothetical protein [Candidatus Eisenbacteria bacterium]